MARQGVRLTVDSQGYDTNGLYTLILLYWIKLNSYESSLKRQVRARTLNWKRALDRWNQPYYCSKDDGVFMPGVTRLVPIQSANALLFGDWEHKASSG